MLDILLGIPNYHNDTYINILNFVILYGKKYVNMCRQTCKEIELYRFQVLLKEHMICEKYIYATQNKSHDFDKRWSALVQKLDI